MSSEQQDGGARALYAQLLGAVGRRAAHIEARQGAHMRCAAGCHACCAPGLSVSLVEALSLADHLAARPEVARAALELEGEDPHRGARCAFLSARGECVVYEARPLVCRTHGAPLLVPVEALEPEGGAGEESGALALTACELNFTEEGALEGVGEGEWHDARQLDQVLALLSARAAQGGAQGGARRAASDRWALRPSALIGEGGPLAPAPQDLGARAANDMKREET